MRTSAARLAHARRGGPRPLRGQRGLLERGARGLRRRRGRPRAGEAGPNPRHSPRQGRDRRTPLSPAGALAEGLTHVSATAAAFDPGTLDVASPEHYEQHGYPHAEWTW